MGTLRVDNLQKEDGSAVITDGTINGTLTETTLRNSGVGMVKIFSQSNQSAASEYDIDSTYINSTYDDYFFTMSCVPSATVDFYARFFVGGTIVTGAEYFYHGSRIDASAYNLDIDGATEMHITHGTATNAGGFVTTAFIRNVNSTVLPAAIKTNTIRYYGSANMRGDDCYGGQDSGSVSSVVNGIRFYMSSGNIEVKDFKLYGITK